MLGSALISVREREGTVIVAKDMKTVSKFMNHFTAEEYLKFTKKLPTPLNFVFASKELNDHKPVVAIIISKHNAYDIGCRSNEHVHRGYSRMYERAQKLIMVDESTLL